jgi:hypothetical protein
MREQTSKIVTLVGGGNEPGFSKNKGLIWDYDSKKCLGELVCPKDIHSVKMDENYIITVAEDFLFIYNYNCKEIFKTKTCKKKNKILISKLTMFLEFVQSTTIKKNL